MLVPREPGDRANGSVTSLVRRAARKPPRVLARRLAQEIHVEVQRVTAPRSERRLTPDRLVHELGSASISELWERLAARPYPAATRVADLDGLDLVSPDERDRVLEAAREALVRRVHLFGRAPLELGRPIDWTRDYRNGHSWPLAYAFHIDYADLAQPSDVKVPWEISRLHWLIPAGQAYVLSGDERYAAAVRELLNEWIEANPYAYTVNWACAMEPAMRIISWTWFFHVFNGSNSWADERFRFRFLKALFLHGEFVARNLERAEVNGNHYLADAAGLVFAGLFFGPGRHPDKWSTEGWAILTDELPRQVSVEGVDYEGSTAYHRLVTELFLLPALYRDVAGFAVPDRYRERVASMARFAGAYTRDDGTSPLIGDSDDARMLPFAASLLDHRYLCGLVAQAWEDEGCAASFRGPVEEILWLLGAGAAASLAASKTVSPQSSCAFHGGGYFVMRTDEDHVFVDCAPLGLGGRGGHAHNDCLSFEATISGTQLITDCGTFAYTGAPHERRRFRSTASHNTPSVDGAEQNRFIAGDLWSLRCDAVPEVLAWVTSEAFDILRAAHTGYERLTEPVTVMRTIALDRMRHALLVVDEFQGVAEHEVRVPFHLAIGVVPTALESGRFKLDTPRGAYVLAWEHPEAWEGTIRESAVSPAYGVKRPTWCVNLVRRGALTPLAVTLGRDAVEPVRFRDAVWRALPGGSQ
ncbi:MAG: heparinase II/III family protein [Gaiellaceae bacterium]